MKRVAGLRRGGCRCAARRAPRAAQPARSAASRVERASAGASAIRSSLRGRHVARDDLRLDLEVGRHAHHAQRLLHDLAEHRRGDVAAVVLAVARLVDHHRDDDARLARSAPCRRTTSGTCSARSRAFLLVRGAGLAADRVAERLRLRRGAARAGGQAAASRAPRARSSARTRARRRAGCGLALSIVTGISSPSRANTV